MKPNNQNFIDINEAIKNFSYIANIVDKKGDVIITVDQQSKYIISSYNNSSYNINIKEKINSLAKDILIKNLDVFKELKL